MADKFSAITYAAAKKMAADSLKGAGAIKGQKGDKGDPGATGPQGEQGIQGEPGKTPTFAARNTTVGTTPRVDITQTGDAQYAMDFTFVKGDKGDQGERGVQGEPGPAGIQGIQGVKGDKGDTGPAGPAGPQGNPGEQGTPGVRGEKGDPGAQGAPGADGKSFTIQAQYANEAELKAAHPEGAAGDAYLVGADNNPDLYVWLAENSRWDNTGKISGIQGPQGPQGPQGEPGPAGQQGIQGVKGDKGEKGDPGAPGGKGEKGDPGPQGIQGEAGPAGAQGDTGAAGAAGKDGISPTITSERIDGHTVLDITDAAGTKKVQIPDGAKGDKGDKGDTGAPGVTLPDNVYKLNEEVVIGKWINGKPIYRLVLTATEAGNGKEQKLDITDKLSDYDDVINMQMTTNMKNSGTVLPSSFRWEYSADSHEFYINKVSGRTTLHYMAYYGQNAYRNAVLMFIFEYTKTTDKAS